MSSLAQVNFSFTDQDDVEQTGEEVVTHLHLIDVHLNVIFNSGFFEIG